MEDARTVLAGLVMADLDDPATWPQRLVIDGG